MCCPAPPACKTAKASAYVTLGIGLWPGKCGGRRQTYANSKECGKNGALRVETRRYVRKRNPHLHTRSSCGEHVGSTGSWDFRFITLQGGPSGGPVMESKPPSAAAATS